LIATQKKRWNCHCSKKNHPHNHTDLPPLISVEATRVCIPVGKRKILLAAVYKSQGCTWSDTDIALLLNSDINTFLAGDLNAKHTSWNSFKPFRRETAAIV
jgi:hypothetical protein